jgi:hypothetical protein
MTTEEQIEIIEKLIEATEELNGEFQEGWDKEIEDGRKLVEHLIKTTLDDNDIADQRIIDGLSKLNSGGDNYREFLEWISEEPSFDINNEDIREILSDWKTYSITK